MNRSSGARARSRHVSPRGDEFDVVGRAAPVRSGPAPHVPAEAREELLVIKDGDIFCCARPDGDIHPARVTGEGLYAHDTRYLSELRVLLGGRPPVPLSYTAETGYRAVVNATNATLKVRRPGGNPPADGQRAAGPDARRQAVPPPAAAQLPAGPGIDEPPGMARSRFRRRLRGARRQSPQRPWACARAEGHTTRSRSGPRRRRRGVPRERGGVQPTARPDHVRRRTRLR